jgi:ABC-type branched-subunit amino acid transport system substrate-binding protein
VVAEFAQLGRCDKRLVPAVYDSGSTAVETTQTLVNQILSLSSEQPRPRALVGPARSDSAVAVAPLGSIYDLPMFSYWASSAELVRRMRLAVSTPYRTRLSLLSMPSRSAEYMPSRD